MVSLETLARDQEALRQQWRALGLHEGKTFADYLDRALESYPEVPVRFMDEGRWREETVGDLCLAAQAIAASLAAMGVDANDRVAVQLSAGRDALVSYLAVLSMGAVLVPIVPIYGSTEVSLILRDADAKLLIAPAQFKGTSLSDRVRQLVEVPPLLQVIAVGTGETGADFLSFEQLEEQGAGQLPPRATDAGARCLLIYTSGTSASPKGVQHSHDTLLADFRCPLFSDKGLFLNVLPAGHIGGLIYLLRPVILGVEQIFLNPWKPLDAARLIEAHKVRESGATPIFLLQLLDAAAQEGIDISSLNYFGLGGAGVTPQQVLLTDQNGFPSGRGYGLTEHPTISTSLGKAPQAKRHHTDGQITPGNEVRIVDEHNNDVPMGEEGEIVSRGPELFLGYTDDALNREAFLPGGWFRTGDVGKLDADGYLTITDRKKDIIIRGGENISSKEVEAVLCMIAEVAESAVVAMPDPVYGERVCAFVRMAPGTEALTLESVKAHFAHASIAKQKTPEHLFIVEDFPRVASGKIRKQELRAQLRIHTKGKIYAQAGL
ncbi:MAG: AMP-binding protein [Sphingorhabdus sp.]